MWDIMTKEQVYPARNLPKTKIVCTLGPATDSEEVLQGLIENGMSIARLQAKSNARAVTLPRQVAMYLCKELTPASLPEIGRSLGGKHHTTVIHALTKIERRRQDDQELNRIIHKLTDRFD